MSEHNDVPAERGRDELRVCTGCGKEKVLSAENFYRLTRAKKREGFETRCKACRAAKRRSRREADETFRARERRYGREYRQRHIARERRRYLRYHNEKRTTDAELLRRARARQAVRDAVKRGIITKPGACERCGSPRNIEGHHPDYDQPLMVEWLCAICHGEEHRNAA